MTDLVAQAVAKMVEFYNGNTHDVCHFIKVHSYAATIGRLEGLDEETLTTLELAAIVHDIAIPLCREKYGSADGKHQEQEGPALARKFMQELGVDEKRTQRVEYMVGHHHTYTNVDGVDMRIMLEADFLVNADEGGLLKPAIRQMREHVFRTATGVRLLDSIYSLDKE